MNDPRSARKRKAVSSLDSSIGASDRYIPQRSLDSTSSDFSNFESIADRFTSPNEDQQKSPNSLQHSMLLANALGLKKQRVLNFKATVPVCKTDAFEAMLNLENQAKCQKKTKQIRHISKAPVRILDAPDFVDDFYLNLIDWGRTNHLAVALGSAMYLWNAETCDIKLLSDFTSDSSEENLIDGQRFDISSVKFSHASESVMAVGLDGETHGEKSEIAILNCEKEKLIRRIRGHKGRIGKVEFGDDNLLTSASRDSTILRHDLRIRNHVVAQFTGHTLEVCNLAWKSCGNVLASASNDNFINLYDIRKSHSSDSLSNDATVVSKHKPMFTLSGHLGCVKGLAFSPFYNNVLVSGGGNTCKTIKMWNVQNGEMIKTQYAGFPVSNIDFNPFENELIASTGNKLCLYSYPTLTKLKEIDAHEDRILKTALSPCGQYICSAGADETLKFWKMFGKYETQEIDQINEKLKKKTPDYVKFKLR